MTVFVGYLTLISIQLTLETLFNQISKHLEYRQNILRHGSYFQLFSECLEMFDIYYFKMLYIKKLDSISIFF